MIDFSPHPGSLGRQRLDIGREYCTAILRILQDGWQSATASPDVHAGAGEVVITEHLRAGMRDTLGARSEPWFKRMTVLAGTEWRSNPDVATPDGVTDIPILFQRIREARNDHDPHAIVECKRVAGGNAHLCREYVVNGIDRFRTGQYAGHHTAGFMAGYLLSGDAESATSSINGYLTRRGRESEHLESSAILDAAWAKSSHHPRAAPAAPIDLHHALFRLPPIPS